MKVFHVEVRRFALLAAATFLIPILGCSGSHPGVWKQAEIEKEIKERLHLTEISMTGDAASGYTATGTDTNGEPFKVTIKQFPAEKKLTYKAEGGRGTVEEGKVEFK